MSRRAVFLDRDGVIVDTFVRGGRGFAPLALDDFRIADGAGPQVERLRQTGLLPIVFTNQPDVGRGLISQATLAEMHAQLRLTVPVEDIFVCTHDNDDGCACRKPKPGMLKAAAEKWKVDLGRSFVVGDRWRDVEAGRAVGCYTILIDRPYSGEAAPDVRVQDLTEAVEAVLTRMRDQAWNS